jgi:hypothetical protein
VLFVIIHAVSTLAPLGIRLLRCTMAEIR